MQQIDNSTIQNILPQSFPVLMIDYVKSLDDNRQITAIKKVTESDFYFSGTTNASQIFNQILLVEVVAQTGAVLVLHSVHSKKLLPYLVRIRHFKFTKSVKIGDTLTINLSITNQSELFGQAFGEVFVQNHQVCEGEVSFALNPN